VTSDDGQGHRIEAWRRLVLLIEYDAAYRTALAAELRHAGFHPIECATTLEALDAIDHTPSIGLAVVSDIMRPKSPNFLSFARMMNLRNKHSRIVLISQLDDTRTVLDESDKKLFESIVEWAPDVQRMAGDIVKALGFETQGLAP